MIQQLLNISKLCSGQYVPFLLPFWGKEEWKSIHNWLQGGASFTESLSLLKEDITGFFGKEYAVCLSNSGRSALFLSLKATGLHSHDEVIVPAFCCAAVLKPILSLGLRPVLADIDEDFNLCFKSVQKVYSPSVKAIIIAHLSGKWCTGTESILSWAREKNIWVIEDVAQATGLMHQGQPAGTFGDIAIFSTGLGKTIFEPGGGWLITRQPHLKEFFNSLALPDEKYEHIKARISSFISQFPASENERSKAILYYGLSSVINRYRNVFKTNQVDFPIFGMSDIEAHLALSGMYKLQQILHRQRKFALSWHNLLKKPHFKSILLPDTSEHNFTKMLISFTGPQAHTECARLKSVLRKLGIEIEASYTPLHLRRPFTHLRRGNLPVTERLWEHAFVLPTRPNLPEDIFERFEEELKNYSKGIGSLHDT